MSSRRFADIKERLRKYSDEKWRFGIYYCTYGDDEAWERMMRRLNIQSRENLKCHDAEDLAPRIDWAVENDR